MVRSFALMLLSSSLTLAAQTSLPATATVPNLNDPVALLAAARATNGLTGDDLKPWHLKASYDLFDDDGKPLATGVFEEWWVAKDKWKQSYTGSHYTGTIYRSPEGYATDGERVPWPETLIESAIISPIEDKFIGRLHPLPPTLSDAKPPLSCLAISSEDQVVGKPPYDYCFDVGTTSMRVRKALFANTVYPRTGRFQGHSVGLETLIQVNHQVLASVHLASLSSLPDGSTDLVAPKPGLALPVVSDSAKTSQTPPMLVSSKDPVLPLSLSQEQRGGHVDLRITVETTGKVSRSHILDAENEALANAAKEAVLKWRFKPATQGGLPIAVDVNAEFNFGPH